MLVRRVRSTGSSVVSDQLPPLATPVEVAEYLRTTTAALAQDRYKGTGPKFIKRGRRVLYRWSDVLEWLDRNTIKRTDERRT
jgi:hypothetical protein